MPRLVVVNDFDVVSALGRPDKADAPLLIDADRVLATAVSFQGFKSVGGVSIQVGERAGGIEQRELYFDILPIPGWPKLPLVT